MLRQTAPYLDEAPAGAREESAAESVGVYVLEGSKPGAAAAAVWLAHTTIPLDTTGHGALVRETIRDACELHVLLEHWPELAAEQPVRAVTLCPPDSNILCYAFRPTGSGADLPELNRLNRAVYRELSLPEERRRHVYDQRFFVSRSTLHLGQYGPLTPHPPGIRGLPRQSPQRLGSLTVRVSFHAPSCHFRATGVSGFLPQGTGSEWREGNCREREDRPSGMAVAHTRRVGSSNRPTPPPWRDGFSVPSREGREALTASSRHVDCTYLHFRMMRMACSSGLEVLPLGEL
ncbi:MAG TPA: hypothetical protein VNB06_07625 [Thermoanaerobaculia bacterium]|nr:hypothetical protein [Thermoanaerobaculia bacterium]